ncbi:MAG TPA: acyclic terpene utilization AtuA family protein [Chloroflexota bacterium]|jgi:hypothetical protein
MLGGVIRIGEGAGYSGAWLEPAVDLAARGALDYLLFECLAERTIALAQLARLADPAGGYDPYLVRRMEAVLGHCRAGGTRILTNAGAANPGAAGQAVADVARRLGLAGLRVGVVTGDDVLGRLDPGLTLAETGQTLGQLGDRVVSANAYLGAEPLIEALAAGADVVVAGRIADPSLALAALRHAHGWAADDWPLLGAGTAVGHLTECGPQVTGGYFADPGRVDVPELAAIGSPIAECAADGTAVITKLPGTGGAVSFATCAEQLLYEVGDPAAYLTPDVAADFSRVELEPAGPDRVRVRGAGGRPAPATLKVSVGYRDGFAGEGQISYGGAGCVARARAAAEAVLRRLESAGLGRRELRADLIGLDALFGRPLGDAEPGEVRLRVAARVDRREEAEAVGRAVEALWIGGPYGGAGATRAVREVIAIGSVFVRREMVEPRVALLEA